MKQWLFLMTGLVCWMALGPLLCGRRNNQADVSPDFRAQRIVCAAPNLAEIAFAMGIGPRVVAVANESNWPPEAAERRRIGGFWQPDIEAVIAARPDLVVTLAFEQQASLARRLNSLGYRTVSVAIEQIEDLFDALDTIGPACGAAPQADALAARLRSRLHELSRRRRSGPRPSVLWVVQTEPLRIAGKKTFISDLIELAGAVNAAGPSIYKYPTIGPEQLIAWDPQVIIQPAENPDVRRRELSVYFQRYCELSAVRNKRIFCVPADIVSRIGPRICEAAEAIALAMDGKADRN
jgi:iron complex transport system substrate-binding protein